MRNDHLLLDFIQGLFEWCDAYYSIAICFSIIMLSGSHVLEIWLLNVSKEHATFKNILWNIHKGGNSDDSLFWIFRNDFLGCLAIASCLHLCKNKTIFKSSHRKLMNSRCREATLMFVMSKQTMQVYWKLMDTSRLARFMDRCSMSTSFTTAFIAALVPS